MAPLTGTVHAVLLPVGWDLRDRVEHTPAWLVADTEAAPEHGCEGVLARRDPRRNVQRETRHNCCCTFEDRAVLM